MDKVGGIFFSLAFAMLGWLFAPWDTEPRAALWVSVAMSVVGLSSMTYFCCRKRDWG